MALATPDTHHTVGIPQVVQILQGAQSRGLDAGALLRRAGISPALLDSPLARVTQAQYAALILILRRSLRDELWGLCSLPLKPGGFVHCCRQLIHCSTLGEALRVGFAYYHLLLSDFAPRLQVSDRMVRAKVTPYALPNQGHTSARLYAERSFIFFTYGLACWLVARRIPLQQVIYPAMEEGRLTDAGRLFQAPVEYKNDSTELLFDERWLALPIVQNPQSLGEFLSQAPANLLVKYRDQTNLTERIRRLLRRQLANELPSLEEVSAALAMTPQTLRRRLQHEGQGFQAIKDDLRRDVAIACLAQPELTLPDIASRLGFAEASTFHRAFKGWTGLSPGAYRQQL
mgnify:CR=1 FL=1